MYELQCIANLKSVHCQKLQRRFGCIAFARVLLAEEQGGGRTCERIQGENTGKRPLWARGMSSFNPRGLMPSISCNPPVHYCNLSMFFYNPIYCTCSDCTSPRRRLAESELAIATALSVDIDIVNIISIKSSQKKARPEHT